jgi:hypothetical protein
VNRLTGKNATGVVYIVRMLKALLVTKEITDVQIYEVLLRLLL